MATAERRIREEGKVLRDGAEPLVAGEALAIPTKTGVRANPLNLLVPVSTTVIALPVLLYVTGDAMISRLRKKEEIHKRSHDSDWMFLILLLPLLSPES